MRTKKEPTASQELSDKISDLLSRRRGPREQKEEHPQKPKKFTVEYFSDDKQLESRWTYDLSRQPYGPILVENFGKDYEKSRRKPKKSADS